MEMRKISCWGKMLAYKQQGNEIINLLPSISRVLRACPPLIAISKAVEGHQSDLTSPMISTFDAHQFHFQARTLHQENCLIKGSENANTNHPELLLLKCSLGRCPQNRSPLRLLIHQDYASNALCRHVSAVLFLEVKLLSGTMPLLCLD